jgi:O-antigen/teichoic acid export membrane protein
LVQLVFTILAALVAPLLIIFVIPAIANEVAGIAVKIRGVRRGHVGPSPAGHLEIWRWKEMLIEAVPLSAGFALIQITSKIDLLILARMDSFESVGLYSIGCKFADFAREVPWAVVTPFSTLMVSAWPTLPDSFRELVHRAGAIIAIVFACGLAAFWPVTDTLLVLMYGERFEAASFATRLLVAGSAPSALAQLGLMALVCAGKHRIYPWIALLGLVINIGLNLVLIPRLSYNGAAWAAILSQFVMLVAVSLVVRFTIRIPKLLPLVPVLGSAAIASIVIAVTTFVPGVRSIPWPLLAAMSATVTVLAAHLLGFTGGLELRSLVRRAFWNRTKG